MDFNGKPSLVPRVVFFAVSDIKVGEELCIDYVPKRDAAAMRKELVCYCGNPKVGEANATCRVSFIYSFQRFSHTLSDARLRAQGWIF